MIRIFPCVFSCIFSKTLIRLPKLQRSIPASGSSKIESSIIEKQAYVEDYCVIKDGTHMISGSRVCSHCEISNTTLNADSRIGSHSHIWDTQIGARAIVGSGVVTINYEANRKQSKCVIGDDAIVGCNSCLVLPVDIGIGAFVAAGSTITDNIPPEALGIAREYQSNINGWAKRRKNHGKHF